MCCALSLMVTPVTLITHSENCHMCHICIIPYLSILFPTGGHYSWYFTLSGNLFLPRRYFSREVISFRKLHCREVTYLRKSHYREVKSHLPGSRISWELSFSYVSPYSAATAEENGCFDTTAAAAAEMTKVKVAGTIRARSGH